MPLFVEIRGAEEDEVSVDGQYGERKAGFVRTINPAGEIEYIFYKCRRDDMGSTISRTKRFDDKLRLETLIELKIGEVYEMEINPLTGKPRIIHFEHH